MGGCRCVFRGCDTNTQHNRSISFFHFPIKETKRCERWVELAKAQHIAALPKSKQRNRVICARHFRDECFMNYKKNSLTRLALPTIWRLNKYTAIDYENNEENGELVILKEPSQPHLIPPTDFVCPLGFTDHNDNNQLLKRKMIEMGIFTPDNDSDNSSSVLLVKNATVKTSVKRRFFEENEVKIKQQQQQQPKILNGQICKKVDSEKLFVTENYDNNDSGSNDISIEMVLTSDVNSFNSNFLTIDEGTLSSINENSANDDVQIESGYNHESTDVTLPIAITMTNNFIKNDGNNDEEEAEQYKTHNTTINSNENTIPIAINIEQNNVNNNTENDREIALTERVKLLENTVAGLTDDLSKATVELDIKKMEIEDYKKKCDNYVRLLQQQQQQQHRFNAKELHYQQELKKMNYTRRVFNKRYEELQKTNKQLQEKCERLEKWQNDQQLQDEQQFSEQQQQLELLQSTIESTVANQMTSESAITSSNSLPAIQVPQTPITSPPPPLRAQQARAIAPVSVQPLSKAQLFNSVKRYISVAMSSLLRMEMFSNTDRPWKQDEKQIAVDILRLGDTVYKYLVEEWRFRLPPITDVREWSTMNNDLNDENDL